MVVDTLSAGQRLFTWSAAAFSWLSTIISTNCGGAWFGWFTRPCFWINRGGRADPLELQHPCRAPFRSPRRDRSADLGVSSFQRFARLNVELLTGLGFEAMVLARDGAEVTA